MPWINATRENPMATDHFDQFVRSLTVAPSRRGLAGIIPAGLLAAAGWDVVSHMTAGEVQGRR